MPYRNLNDETLVMLTLAGEQSAYEALVKRYQSAAVASAHSVTHNQFMAEDSAQDAFVTAWMKLDKLNEPQKFGAWVCRIAKNCAINTVNRYRSFIPLESVENYDIALEDSPAEQYMQKQDSEELRRSVERLPDKVRTIIGLYYFEGLSIVEIADKLRITQGTVKSQLHDGRKKIRKELCAMNEKWNDTLVEKVMKKVEELKLWQFKTSKEGFDVIYKDVLREVEELPESNKKYHALADVLLRGWWWLPGEKNNALFARIKEAAELGHNDDVIEFIVTREDDTIPYYNIGAKIEFIRDKQIPYLEGAGFRVALAREWLWLAYYCFREKQYESGLDAVEKAKALLTPADAYYALALNTPWAKEMLESSFEDTAKWRFGFQYQAIELRYVNSLPLHWNRHTMGFGYRDSLDPDIHDIMRAASLCDGNFFIPSLSVGESMAGSDGTTLTFAADNETVRTPIGTFEGCKLWITKSFSHYKGKSTYRVYYKDGVGIVKYTITNDGITDTRLLCNYRISGGDGLLPLAVGNTWEYAPEYDPDYIRAELCLEVTYSDGRSVMIAQKGLIERIKYNENSWLDMIEEVRTEYCTEDEHGNEKLVDVSHAIERAEALARTPLEKAHTKAAASVARRIMETDEDLNPTCSATGLWNFFQKYVIHSKDGKIRTARNHRWSFEWKRWAENCDPLLCNHIYGMLEDAGKYLWSDEWQVGTDTIIEYSLHDCPLKIKINCTEGGTVTCAAGTFENTLKVAFDIKGLDSSGLQYRGGYKEYYFAEGVGIVRIVNELEDEQKAVYELSYYEGIGDGYMPFADGLVRKYEAVGLTDGFYASTEYTYVADEDGDIVIFADKTGIKRKLEPITLYSAIEGEKIEERLWDEGKRDESRLRHDINNLAIMLHFFTRPNRHRSAQHKAAAWGDYKIRSVEFMANGGEIPEAWLGFYCWQYFVTSPALFACGEREKAYEYIEKAFELYERWSAIPDGTALDIGNELIYGGIKFIKGKEVIELPDGTREYITNGYILNMKASKMYHGMTAKSGWEWFNEARKEDRFKAYIERARVLMEKEQNK